MDSTRITTITFGTATGTTTATTISTAKTTTAVAAPSAPIFSLLYSYHKRNCPVGSGRVGHSVQ